VGLATGGVGNGAARGDPRTWLQPSIYRSPLLRPPRFPARPRPWFRRGTRGRRAATAGARIRADETSATTSQRPSRQSPPAERRCRHGCGGSTLKPRATSTALPPQERRLPWPVNSRIHDEWQRRGSQTTSGQPFSKRSTSTPASRAIASRAFHASSTRTTSFGR